LYFFRLGETRISIKTLDKKDTIFKSKEIEEERMRLNQKIQIFDIEKKILTDIKNNANLDPKSRFKLQNAIKERDVYLAKAQSLASNFIGFYGLPEDNQRELLQETYNLLNKDSGITASINLGINKTVIDLKAKIDSAQNKFNKLLNSYTQDSVLIKRQSNDIAFLKQQLIVQYNHVVDSVNNINRDSIETLVVMLKRMNDTIKTYQEIIAEQQLKLDQTGPIKVIDNKALPISSRQMKTPSGKGGCYEVKNRTWFLGGKLSITLSDTVSFELQKGITEITVYISCEAPKGTKVIDTDTVEIKGTKIPIIQKIDIKKGEEKNKIVSFTLAPGFKKGMYFIRFYTLDDSYRFYETKIEICK
jgi:hypothetical protein